MKIYTKTGDDGLTFWRAGEKILKSDIRIEAYGAIDELNCYIGLIKDLNETKNYTDFLLWIQKKLMLIGSILFETDFQANFELKEEDVLQIEQEIDKIDKKVKKLHSFIVPGGHVVVSQIHIARCVCRRAERECTRLSTQFDINILVIRFLNRFSDYLFMLARIMAKELNVEEIKWNKNL